MVKLIETVYNFLWGDLLTVPLPGGGTLPLSLLVILLIPTGVYFTIRTKFLPIRLFKDMVGALFDKSGGRTDKGSNPHPENSTSSASGNCGNYTDQIAHSNTSCCGNNQSLDDGKCALFFVFFFEATLSQIYKEKDPLYGGYRGGPAYYIHRYFEEKSGKKKRYVLLSVLFAISGLICWCGISQVVINSVASAFKNAFHIPPIYTTVILVILAAIIVLRKNATVKVLDIIVPIMAGFYLLITLFIIITNITQLPGVFERIFSEAFGFRQVAAGGFGAVLMNGIKRGLFSNEAGSGSAPCAAAAAVADNPVKVGLTQALGVFIDTLMICSCTAMIMLLTPTKLTVGLVGMDLLQKAMEYHLGSFGVIFIAITLWLFSFSTFIGILFYARSNVAYLFGDNWFSQTAYKVLALAMLFVGGLAAYTIVWDLGDVGIGLMTIFNIIMLYPLSKKALNALKEYEKKKF